MVTQIKWQRHQRKIYLPMDNCTLVTSQYNPAFIVEFKDIFPVSLTNLQFDATISDVEYITAEVTFKHQQFFIRDKEFETSYEF